jgi:hypothetical protein
LPSGGHGIAHAQFQHRQLQARFAVFRAFLHGVLQLDQGRLQVALLLVLLGFGQQGGRRFGTTAGGQAGHQEGARNEGCGKFELGDVTRHLGSLGDLAWISLFKDGEISTPTIIPEGIVCKPHKLGRCCKRPHNIDNRKENVF